MEEERVITGSFGRLLITLYPIRNGQTTRHKSVYSPAAEVAVFKPQSNKVNATRAVVDFFVFFLNFSFHLSFFAELCSILCFPSLFLPLFLGVTHLKRLWENYFTWRIFLLLRKQCSSYFFLLPRQIIVSFFQWHGTKALKIRLMFFLS